MEYENKQKEAVARLYDAIGIINAIPEERYKYIPQNIKIATNRILKAIDIVFEDLKEKE